MKKYLLTLFIAIFIPGYFVFAHPGNTDSSGCHTCRTNCSSWGLSTGQYHCHKAKIAPQPIEPIKSTYGANGTGYTTPAPEYKQPVVTNIAPEKIQVRATSSVSTKTAPVVTPIKVEEKKVSWFIRLINWFK